MKNKNTAKENNTKTIPFTKKQFLALLKVVYLGNWMANANRVDDKQEEYESIEDYIFSLAPQFGLEKYVDHEERDGNRYYPTNAFEEGSDVHKLHDEYDEETFWDELADRLVTREFTEKYSESDSQKMTEEERFFKLYECIEEVQEELNEFGLERIRIQSNTKIDVN